TYVGDTPQKRAHTIGLAGNVAPFFAIGTMFNIDMVRKSNQNANTEIALKGRWKGRFSQVMYQDCFHAGTDVEWFKNWSGQGNLFNNVYVLRDFKYSGCDGQGNNLYRGYDENAECPKESALELPEDFYNSLMSSFVNDSENVGRFFDDPKVAWEATATMNNDGSLYIIQKLCVAAANMHRVRDDQFETRISEIKTEILEKIRSYYQSEDSSDRLEKNIESAFDVLNEFDASVGNNNYFFGRLIDMLQITDDEAYDKVHEIILSPDLIEIVNSFPESEIYMGRLPECRTVDEVLEAYAKVYNKPSAEAARKYLEGKGIDPNTLVSRPNVSKRTNSYVIADHLMKYWLEKLSSAAFLSRTVSDSKFDMGVMSSLIENIQEMSKTVNMTDYMSECIADFVNVVAISTAHEFLVADILRHCINTFVTDLGYSLLDEQTRKNLDAVAKSRNMVVSKPVDHNCKSSYDEEELTSLFDEISRQSGAMAPSFSCHYNIWLDYMLLSFLATAGNVSVIENPEANNRIGNIISSLDETL
ncbi:MAG: virulence factor SrfC family protein, partial [Candidatus Cryptobacteroides sp.]